MTVKPQLVGDWRAIEFTRRAAELCSKKQEVEAAAGHSAGGHSSAGLRTISADPPGEGENDRS